MAITYRTFQLKLNPIKDRKRIVWLESQKKGITKTLRELIDEAISTETRGRSPGAGEPVAIDLVAIRRIFEAVLDKRMISVVPGAAAGKEDQVLADRLDGLFQ